MPLRLNILPIAQRGIWDEIVSRQCIEKNIMKAIPLTKKTREVAEKLVWFESPEKALSDPVRFMAYAFARATHEDMKVLRTYTSRVRGR